MFSGNKFKLWIVVALMSIPSLFSQPIYAVNIPWTGQLIKDQVHFHSAHSADIDGDGDMDIIAADAIGDYVGWWENTTGDGTVWIEHSVQTNYNQARAVVAGDIDGDNDMDIIGVATADGDVTWWENLSGDGSSWVRRDVDTNYAYVYGLNIADMDADGDLDILATSSGIDTVAWWENNNGSGLSWTKHDIGNLHGARSVQIIDINGDGDLDVVSAGMGSNGGVFWWDNVYGDSLTWTQNIIDDDFFGAIFVFVEDIDNDNDYDIFAIAQNRTEVAWWENTSGNGSTWSKHLIDDTYNGGQYIHLTDLDLDGDQDVLGVALYDESAVWWENTSGDGSTWLRRSMSPSFNNEQSESIYAADVDGDGDPDVMGAIEGTLYLWKNNLPTPKDLTFPAHYFGAGTNAPHDTFSADINGDGLVDLLAAAQNSNEIAWWEHDTGPSSTWTKRVISNTFSGAHSVHVDDVDGDGDLDVLGAALYGQDISWFENIGGNGLSWIEHNLTSTFAGAGDVFTADVDGDGDIDVLGAGWYANSITWWENTIGDGSIWAEQAITTNFDYARAVYATDVDLDGDIDVIGAAWQEDAITWWKNTTGDGSIWTEQVIDANANGAWDVFTADVDGDGDIDVLGTAKDDDDISWYENTNGIATSWTKHILKNDFDGAASVYAADLDQDNDMDIIGTARYAGDVIWWENNDADGSSWTAHLIDNAFNGAMGLHVNDMDNDTDPDIIATAFYAANMAWFENQTTIHSETQPIGNSVDGATEATTTDIDGDGDLDIVAVAKEGDQVLLWHNVDGLGAAWTQQTIDAASYGATSVATGDLNGDTYEDIVVAAQDGDEIIWYANTSGDGNSWLAYPVDTAVNGASAVFVADIDSDGDLDIAGTAYDTHTVSWWENSAGNGSTWTKHTLDSDFGHPTSVYVADINGDAYLDILSTSHMHWDVSWWENPGIGSGSWTEHLIDGSFGGAYDVYAADIDGDGDMDVAGAAHLASLIVWWENDTGNGSSWNEHTVQGFYRMAASVSAADVDGDGDIDLLGASENFDDVTWWENETGSGDSWDEHSIVTLFDGASSVHPSDINQDGKIDVVGTTFNADTVAWWRQK